MKPSPKLLWQLFFTFFKIGAFTFGGGYAMIPLIQRETVDSKHWVSTDDILEIVAIAESTPGPVAINAATFVGYRTCGFWGSLCATFGVILPSFLIIFVLSGVLRMFYDLAPVRYAFFGIRAGVLALLIKALWSMYKQCPKSALAYMVMGLAFIAVALLKIDVLYVIVGCALFGLISSFIAKRRAEK